MAEASLSRNIGHLVPVLARSLPEHKYNAGANMVSFWLDKVLVVIYPDKVLLNRIESREQAEEVMQRINRMLTELVQESGSVCDE